MTSYSFARKYCQAQGGDLVQPKTEEINLHLIELAGGNSYWFGLDDINQEGTFQWIDGTPLDNNGFPAWSDGDTTLFENERCVHQQVNNGWRKRRCTSYLRFACEKPPSPRQILPVRLMAATQSPYGGGLVNASFVCLLGSENEEILTFSTRRLNRLTESITSDSYTAPGDSNVVSSVVLRQTLPATMEGLGFFECSTVTASRMTSVPLGILLSSRTYTQTVNN
ncbi:secretory phospholipase A2 receptor-like [Strongylocentrotus purpuratus]|uniref:C-type lectin domain-containing protein n=1 Tax=Strongylocentrotus purpuratus TaxID=7668 RepID=A0A7M7HNK7_STRPU|nr:secretory phospholipase A2 receptor-like [Strongylocentrotus purpuratus]|eukprot:XP_011676125.1 PREDICTED: secretory phospholipase A2 receptor-like [Strongylocentrotus purpuratus]